MAPPVTRTGCSSRRHAVAAVPGGHFLATVGAGRWTGTERYLGASMFWDHAGTSTYLRWLEAAGMAPIWHRFIPEGDSGHSLILARAT